MTIDSLKRSICKLAFRKGFAGQKHNPLFSQDFIMIISPSVKVHFAGHYPNREKIHASRIDPRNVVGGVSQRGYTLSRNMHGFSRS